MKCKYCGSPTQKNWKHCNQCGKSIDVKNKRPIGLVLMMIISVFCILYFAMMLYVPIVQLFNL